MFEPTQFRTAISPNTFTAQDAGIYSFLENTPTVLYNFQVKLLVVN